MDANSSRRVALFYDNENDNESDSGSEKRIN